MIETVLGDIKVIAGTDGIHETKVSELQDKNIKTYNLEGHPVTPAYRGLVIRKQGNRAKKVMMK